jgi:alanyl-tRNA synthetase
MGFERMCCVLQKKDSVYDTDLFVPTIQVIENYLQLAPAALRDSPVSPSHQRRLRIVADHARTAFMLVNDGLVPSNVGAGYVLRMIIRRMVYNVMLLHEFPLEKYPDFLRDVLASFQGLRDFKQEEIIRVLMDEVKLFQKTLQNGMQILEGLISRSSSQGQMLGSDVFKLYDTYGFPVELTREIVAEKGLSIDEKGFETALESAKEKSRQATKEMFKKGIDWSKYLEGIPQTEFIGYTAFSSDAPQLLKEIDLEGQKILIFDKTPFYPEMGGQM